MSKEDDGGPALCSRCERPLPMQIDLRDWFAGQTLVGLWAHPTIEGSPESLAGVAYAQADAMLAKRSKP